MCCSGTRREENIENVPTVNATFIRYEKAWKQTCIVSKCWIFNLTSWAECRSKIDLPSSSGRMYLKDFQAIHWAEIQLKQLLPIGVFFYFYIFFISMDLFDMNVGNRLAAAPSLCNSEALLTENISTYMSQVALKRNYDLVNMSFNFLMNRS